tara:strand:+ start:2327 stop:2584 length:258 start_codon:yes stop_codon:yes gene_type:complete
LPKKQENNNDYEVYDFNWDIVEMFLRMSTQWSTSFGGFVGLKYEVLLLQGGLFDLYHVEDREEMLEGLRIMENAALKEINKETKK